jgi:phosphatidylglycerol:prolipoprotein diacylglycerol transferase
MYLLGFLISWYLLSRRIRETKQFTAEQLADILFYTALGVIVGGRLGYMFFYDWRVLLNEPLLIFETWKGGMSFHGGLIGVMLALAWYAYRSKRSFFELTDFIAPVVPIGLGLGRIGNFINAELWGRSTTLPWGMVFPNAGSTPRHPSQWYEFLLEGLLLFLILWFYSRQPKPRAVVSGLFLLAYGLARFFVEFFREPDVQIGYFWGIFSEGQLLSLPMIFFGIILLLWARRSANATIS